MAFKRKDVSNPSLLTIVLRAGRLDILRSIPFMPIYSAAEVSLAFLAAALIRLIYADKPRLFVGDIVPKALQQVLQFTQSVDRKDLAFAIPLIIMGVGLLKMVSSFLSTYYIERAGYFVSTILREELLGSLLRAPAGRFTQMSASEMTNRVMADSSLMQGAISKGFLGGIRDMIVLIFCFSGMIFVGGHLIVVLVLCLVPFALVVRYLAKVLQRYQTDSARERVRIASHAMDSQAGLLGLAAERETAARLESYRKHTDRLLTLALDTLGRRTLSGPFIEYLAVLGVAILLSFKNSLGQADLATYASLFILGAMTYRPLKNLGTVLSQVTEVSQAYRRLEEIWIQSQPDRTSLSGVDESGNVSAGQNSVLSRGQLALLRDVDYETADGILVLSHVDLHVCAGEIVGFIGESGSGKTTALRLLAGVLKPSKGECNIVPIARLATQRPMILAGSVLDNVDYEPEVRGVPSPLATSERMESAVRLVEKLGLANTPLTASHFLDRQMEPDGLSLSGGEKARVSLARVLHAAAVRQPDPTLLLFDEPTASLDLNRSELFWTTLRETTKHARSRVGAVVVTHHLADLRFCDRVYEFQQGKVMERKEST